MPPEDRQVVRFQTDAEHFTDFVLVMALYQAEHFLAALQAQGVEVHGAAKGAGDNFGLQVAVFNVNDIVGTQQQVDYFGR